MRIGARIRQARKHRGLTQRELGVLVGFDESTADVRIAQYESEVRTPKAELRDKLAEALNINPRYFYNTEQYAAEDIMFLLFELDDDVRLRLTRPDPSEREVHIYIPNNLVNDLLVGWQKVKQAFADGTITKREYDEWKLTWPRSAGKRNHGDAENEWEQDEGATR
jgi:transcriptional regulator with XRE-family HTH domain